MAAPCAICTYLRCTKVWAEAHCKAASSYKAKVAKGDASRKVVCTLPPGEACSAGQSHCFMRKNNQCCKTSGCFGLRKRLCPKNACASAYCLSPSCKRPIWFKAVTCKPNSAMGLVATTVQWCMASLMWPNFSETQPKLICAWAKSG